MPSSNSTKPDSMMKPHDESDPIERLTWHYENPSAQSRGLADQGLPVVGVTSNTVPWELIRAAGAYPCVINPGDGKQEDIHRFMEEGVFEERTRAIFGAAISGDLQYLKLLLIPRTSEQEYKLYLYLREVARREPGRRMPPVYLYDMLHSRSSESYSYGLERTQVLRQRLENLTGIPISEGALRQAIEESNRARKAIRSLLSLRLHEPRMTGTEALALTGASFLISRDEYSQSAERAVKMISERESLAGKRLMISGASLNHRSLHQVLEEHGAVIVAEDDWWGSRSAGGDIDVDSGDLLKAIFEKYYLDTPSPRIFPFEAADAWFQRESLNGVDGVIFYLPPEDCVAGWDYPRRRKYLDEKGIPHLLVREEARSISVECHKQIETFIRSLSQGR